MASLALLRAALDRVIKGTANEAERDALREAVESGDIVVATGERAVAVGGSVHGAVVTGDNNLVLSLDEANVEILRRSLASLFAARDAGAQPPLDVPVLDANEHNRFVYGARRIPFIGRVADLAACKGFLKADGAFRWWLLLGPGGTGKSRLALELCLRVANDWQAGFLPHRHGFTQWRIWQPQRPTLLVVDYAAERAADMRDLMVALASRRGLAFPVRLLLLEREQDAAWWHEIMRGGQEQAVIEAAGFADPRQLAPMSADDLWQAMSAVLGERRAQFEPRRDEILAKLHEIDPRGRPLFAALAADALLSGGDIFRWDRKVLVRDLLIREDRRRWQPAGIDADDPHRMLLALSTALGGLRRDDLRRPDVARLVPGLHFRPRVFQLLTGQPLADARGKRGAAVLPALEPDIIGELFVLEQLSARSDALKEFRKAAWAIDPERFATFINRATRDFDAHPTTAGLALEPDGGTGQTRLAWARMAPAVIAKLLESGDTVGARARLASLIARAKAPGASALVPGPLASAATAVAEHALAQGDTDVARSIYDDIAALAREHVLFLRSLGTVQLTIAFKLVTHLGEKHEFAPVLEVYQSATGLLDAVDARIAALETVAYPKPRTRKLGGGIVEHTGGPPPELEILCGAVEALRLDAARLGVNVLQWIGRSGDLSAAQATFDGIAALAVTQPQQAALRDIAAAAAVNLAIHYGDRGLLAEAASLVERLRDSANAADATTAIRASFGKAAVNIVQAYERAGKWDSGSAPYEALSALAAAHPAQKDLRAYTAMAIEILAGGAGAAGDLERAAALLAELVTLAARYPDDRTLREPLAHAEQAFLIDACARGHGRQAYQAYLRCSEVLARSSRDVVADLGVLLMASLYKADDLVLIAEIRPAVAERSGIGDGARDERESALLLEVLHRLAQAGDVAAARKGHRDLADLVHSRTYGGAAVLAEGLSSLVLGACLASDVDAAKEFYGDLRRLAARSGHAVDMSQHLGLAARNMVILAERTDDTANAASYYSDLHAVPLPSDAEHRRDLADTALRAQLLVARAGDLATVVTIRSDLGALAQAAPDDLEIARRLGRAIYNLVAVHCQQKDLANAQAARADLAPLIARHDDAHLRESYATATFNVSTSAGGAGDLKLATECYAALRSLADRHPGETVLRMLQGQGAHDLSWHRFAGGDLRGADEAQMELAKLSRACPEIEELRLYVVRAADNLLHAAGRRGDLTAARRYYDEVVAAVGGDLDRPDLRHGLCKAAGALILYCMQAQDQQAFARLTRELESAPYRDEVGALVKAQLQCMALQRSP